MYYLLLTIVDLVCPNFKSIHNQFKRTVLNVRHNKNTICNLINGNYRYLLVLCVVIGSYINFKISLIKTLSDSHTNNVHVKLKIN